MSPPSISVFFPAYNDAGSIESLVANALDVLRTITDDYEVLVIDDGSMDATPAVIDALAIKHAAVTAIHHERNMGYGGALRTGFRRATKDLVFYTDGDGQYDVRELAKLYASMTAAVHVVNGYKIRRADSVVRKLVGWTYQHIARLLFRLPIRDVDCDFRLIRRSALERIELSSTTGAICVELVRRLHAAGCVFAEVAVHHYDRRHGQSQFFTLGRVTRTALDLGRLWLRLIVLRGGPGKKPFVARNTTD
jgi:glycosyltransferase involved in cell wall biosynthesis